MPRPVKWRRVGFLPEVTYFKPAGIPLRMIEEVPLSIEELEAIRLKDVECLQQEECAQKMHISRPTFHRVLESARSKIADALINGKAIHIEGGNFEMSHRRFRCGHDGHEWDIPIEEIGDGDPGACPRCKRKNIHPVHPPEKGFGVRGRGGRHGRGWQGK